MSQLSNAFALHRGAYSVAHVPSRSVVASADLPMNLQGADSLLALGHKVNHFKPSNKRIVGIPKNSSAYYREAITILAAAILGLAKPVKRAGFQLIHLFVFAAGALHTISPAKGFKIFFTSFFGSKLALQLMERDAGLTANEFSFLHGYEYSNESNGCHA